MYTIVLVFVCMSSRYVQCLLLNDADAVQQRLNDFESKLQTLTEQLNQQAKLISETKTTFVRWGSHGCGVNATLIYSGQLGGTSHGSTGGGANPLCLAHEVIYGARASDHNMAEMYGAEYQDYFWGPGTLNKDVPCAVCKPKVGGAVIMIPGRNQCFNGWNEQYHGYLSANLDSHPHTSTYICVDENVEFLDGGLGNDEGYLLYGVRGHCGSLKCPPYEGGKPITCVVCTQ